MNEFRKRFATPALRFILGNERGMVLAVTLVLLAILVVFGTTASLITSTDIKIGGNYKLSEQSLYVAKAGTEEGRQRLRLNATSPIADNHPTSDQWRAFIGTLTKTTGKGYSSSNTMHLRVASIQTLLDYTVVIRHKTDSSGNLLLWGDPDDDGLNTQNTITGANIYVITSYGATGPANKIVEVVCTKNILATPAPLYVKANTQIMGASTNVIGNEGTMPDGTSCGADPKHGAVTPLASGSITLSGSPTITGEGGGSQDITYNGPNLDLQAIVASYKDLANYSYNVTSQTLTGMNWGTPTSGATLQDASSCSVSNVVYFNTNDTFVGLIGGSSGCGILLIDGDLNIGGNFSWYGVIVATGSITFTGGGNKQITGAVLSGESVDADMVGGNTDIVYCSKAIRDVANNLPLLTLSWKEGI